MEDAARGAITRSVLPSDQAARMDVRARELKLNPRQQLFSLIHVTQPHLGKAEALRRAGCKSKRANQLASRMAARPNVQKYIEELRAIVQVKPILPELKVQAVLPETVSVPVSALALETDATIADAREVWQGATHLRRARMGRFLDAAGEIRIDRVRRAPPGVVTRYKAPTKRVRTAKDGSVTVEYEGAELELVNGLGIHALLGKFHGIRPPKGKEPGKGRSLRRLLRAMPDDMLRELLRRAAVEDAIDVTPTRSQP